SRSPQSKKRKEDSTKQDFFSNLPDDCILHIFSFLDPNDLDVLSSVSQKVYAFVNKLRVKTPRSQIFHSLRLVQDSFSFKLTMRRNGIKLDLVTIRTTGTGKVMNPADHIAEHRAMKALVLGAERPAIQYIPTAIQKLV
ncbi:hypothetical protein PENTCL1PPCAC_21039, partial [Pristionchus entomophagus]